MKFFITCLAVLFGLQAIAQSPGLTINLSMDTIEAGSQRYKIEMKICEPFKKTARGGWFSHDTSKIDFASLKPGDIDCGQYFDNGMPELISGQEEEPLINKFKFSNQVFAWEKIFVFRITNVSSRGVWPAMYIVVAMPYKSFLTYIDLTDIQFKSDEVIFISKPDAVYGKSSLSVKQSFKGLPFVAVNTYRLKSLLEQK